MKLESGPFLCCHYELVKTDRRTSKEVDLEERPIAGGAQPSVMMLWLFCGTAAQQQRAALSTDEDSITIFRLTMHWLMVNGYRPI